MASDPRRLSLPLLPPPQDRLRRAPPRELNARERAQPDTRLPLAHSLIWALILEPVEPNQVPAERISSAATIKTVLGSSRALQVTRAPERVDFHQGMSQHIGRYRNPCCPAQ